MGFNLPVLNRRRRLLGTATPIFSPATLFTLSEPGIWLDPSDVANLAWRRNLLTWTEQFDNAAWTSSTINAFGSGSVANTTATTDPLGGNTAEYLQENTASSGHGVSQPVTITSGTVYTLTAYFKTAQRSWAVLRVAGTPNINAFFDLSNGTVGTVSSGLTASTPVSVGNGWYRCAISWTSTVTGSQVWFAGMASADNTLSYTGNGTSGIYLWGAQLELGSTATEYQRITDVNTEVIERFPNNTLFQDTAGTTPVTTPGQTVALALDKSKGLVLGPELVTNGTFDTNTTGWAVNTAGPTLSWDTGRAKVVVSGVGQGITQTSWSPVAGRSYRITFTATNGAAASRAFAVTFGGFALDLGSVAAGQSKTFTVTALTNSTASLVVRNSGGDTLSGETFFYDNISVKELPGFHATQATTASRPIYGINPVGGRRNLLTFTEQFDNAAWTKGSATVAANTDVAPNGTTTADTMTATASGANLFFASPGAAQYAMSFYAKRGNSDWAAVSNAAYFAYFNIATGALGTIQNGTATITSVGSGWYRCVWVPADTSQNTQFRIRCAVANGNTTTTTENVILWGAQLETGSTATAYQKVTTQYDVTEAGVASVSYLAFDTSKFLVTPTITPGVDKAQVFAGVRKNSDASDAILVETSTSAGSFNGTLLVTTGPNPSASNRYASFTKGSAGFTNGNFSTTNIGNAPDTAVLATTHDIAGDLTTIRRNGVAGASATVDLGTGNFLAYPMYIGARAGGLGPFNGNLYSLIVRFGANLTTDTITSTETWVNGKTGAYA